MDAIGAGGLELIVVMEAELEAGPDERLEGIMEGSPEGT